MNTGAQTAVMNKEPVLVADEANECTRLHAYEREFNPTYDLQCSSAPGPAPHHNSRRLFVKAGIISLGAVALWLMDSLARRTESIPENSENTLVVPWNAAQGVHFYDRMIVVNGASGVAVFSSTCPHLGCRINRTEGTELVCPCHGSRFSLQGKVAHGPSMRGLRALPFELDRANGVLRVTLESNQT